MFIHLNELCRLVFPALVAAAVTTQSHSCTLAQNHSQTPSDASSARYDAPVEAAPVETIETPLAARELTRWVDCPALLEVPPRGLACLHCLQPQAAAQAEAIVQMMLESCIANVAVNYLVDGSFGYDETALRAHIDALSSGGRRLSLLIYFSNGPTQRKFRNALLDGFATTIPPEEFRSRIQVDDALRDEFRALVISRAPALEYAVSRGAELLLVPMLEDNLDRESFTAMAELLQQALPSSLPYRLGRNPCPTCSEGADSHIPQGFFRETHNLRGARSLRNGVVTNDGEWSALENELQRGVADLSLPELKRGRDAAAAGGNVFILWSAARQGRYTDARGGMPRHVAAERDYAFPTDWERTATIEFLRESKEKAEP